MTTPTAAPIDDDGDWPAPRRGWMLVLLLALASIVSQFDRTVINLMVEPLKADFELNDTQFGMLQSVAFGIFYVLACIPIGRLADNHSRRVIIGSALALWSVFAMCSGLARSYAQLFLTRIGVAVGEASLTPAGLSMLADSFPPERLGRPVSGFLLSAPIGQGLAFIGGGSLLAWLTTTPLMDTPMLNGFEPWQVAFLIVGAPGLLLVPFFFLVREPRRRGSGSKSPLTKREVLAVIISRRRALVPMFCGFAMVLLVAYSFAIWTPALLERTYGWGPGKIGLWYGLVLLVFGTSGVFVAGLLSDWLSARGRADAPLRVAAGGFAVCGVAGAIAPLMPTAELALGLLAIATFCGNMPFPCAATSLQVIVPNRARAQVSAVYVTFTTLIGLSLGPLVVGIMTDFVFRDPSQIRYSLSVVVATAAPVMVILMLVALRPYAAARAQAD
ncbi:spinster family MFS transporter [Sphingopyxis sp. FD7]|uniref:spinster family MFS transporter n=1 Tax=Sphingopyxis sp. FD7 TaxID=1914525 RepID=UPI001558B53F|nr:MFS transporter [Sphingopyxis sp. FD7]